MSKKIAVLLANGFEEVEGLAVVDVLRRAGFVCDMVGVESEIVQGSHGIRIFADKLLQDVVADTYDMVVLPGGLPGADTLRDTEAVVAWVQEFAAREDKFVAAICAAPQVLAKAGVATGKRVTSYPGANFQAMFQDAEYVDDNTMTEDGVIVSGNMITSRGPGTTLPFAYRLVEMLGGPAETLREAMQYNALKASVRAH